MAYMECVGYTVPGHPDQGLPLIPLGENTGCQPARQWVLVLVFSFFHAWDNPSSKRVDSNLRQAMYFARPWFVSAPGFRSRKTLDLWSTETGPPGGQMEKGSYDLLRRNRRFARASPGSDATSSPGSVVVTSEAERPHALRNSRIAAVCLTETRTPDQCLFVSFL